MLDPQLIAFALVVTVIPGVDLALVARSVLSRGRCAGCVTGLGVCIGLWTIRRVGAL